MAASVLDHYIGKDGLTKKNCAQAIVCGYGERFGIDDELVVSFKAYGGGRAPEGKCGAVYAAEYVLEQLGHRDKVEALMSLFEKEAGSTKCRDIRHLKKLSCLGCVQEADLFLKGVLDAEADIPEEVLAV